MLKNMNYYSFINVYLTIVGIQSLFLLEGRIEMKRVFTVIAMFLLMPALVFAGSLSGDGKNIRSAGLKYLANNQNSYNFV